MACNDWRSASIRRGATCFLALALLFPAIRTAFADPQAETVAPACIYSGPSALEPGQTLCIRKDSYNRDLCVAIEHFANASNLPPDYFARLIWRESTFRPDVESPKGAQGIAQFMPGTAKLRGLTNSFDVLEALRKSAQYLDELRNRFGNLGFAAAAYNAGENALSAYLVSGNLPDETYRYVIAITAHSIDEWSDKPPSLAAERLDKDKPFIDGCLALAESRRLREPVFVNEGVWMPWGAQVAAHDQGAVARRLFVRAVSRLPAPLNAEQPLILHQRGARRGSRPRYAARIARQTRAEAETVCSQIHAHGGVCIVFKN